MLWLDSVLSCKLNYSSVVLVRDSFLLPFQPLGFNLRCKPSFKTTSLFPSHCWSLSSPSYWWVITHSKIDLYNLSDVAKGLKIPGNKRFISKTYRSLLLSCGLTAALEKKNKICTHRLKLQRITIFQVYMIFLYFSAWYQIARLDFIANWVITVHSTPVH